MSLRQVWSPPTITAPCLMGPVHTESGAQNISRGVSNLTLRALPMVSDRGRWCGWATRAISVVLSDLHALLSACSFPGLQVVPRRPCTLPSCILSHLLHQHPAAPWAAILLSAHISVGSRIGADLRRWSRDDLSQSWPCGCPPNTSVTAHVTSRRQEPRVRSS